MSIWRLVWVIVFVSAGILGFEIALMRLLLVASWHHFAFLVISIALLGFGASGTGLCFLRSWLLQRDRAALFALSIATALSMAVLSTLAMHVPIESRTVPALQWQQWGYWLLLWSALLLPFLLGAATIGLALMTARRRVGMVYAANLIGSGAGALAAPALMGVMTPPWLVVFMSAPVFIGAAGLLTRGAGSTGVLVASILGAAGWLCWDPPIVRPDPFKYVGRVQQLEQQGSVQQIAGAHSARAVIGFYRGDVFHDVPFLGVGTPPPPMHAMVVDGHWSGSVLRISQTREAEFLDQTLMAFPYDLAPRRPRVLLLGQAGGINIWLALTKQAGAVDVVEPNPNIIELLQGPLAQEAGGILDKPGVRTVVAEPRHFVDHADQSYDLIHLVQLQSLAAGSVGMAGLAEDHLITVQGIGACLDRLRPEGMLFVCRGIQTPPRDNIKLLATFLEALRARGNANPQNHITMVRDYLGVCLVAKASPWRAEQIEQIRRVCRDRQLTPVWFSQIRPDELNAPDALPTPPGGIGDWYYHAAVQLASPRSARFLDDWLFDIRPPTDDRPFFLDFCKLKSIRAQKEAFGDLWRTRTEMAFLFVCNALLAIALAGLLLTVFPLWCLRSVRRAAGKSSTAAYFTAIGLAYLLLEMTLMSRLTFLIGDPVRAAAVTIAAFLLLSGLGSFTVGVFGAKLLSVMGRATTLLVLVGIAVLTLVGPVTSLTGGHSMPTRCAAAVLTIAPLALLMGLPMPAALLRLQHGAPALVPWAWGVNGFASVLAAPLATAIGMTWGYRYAAAVALLLYLAAAALYGRLPGPAQEQ